MKLAEARKLVEGLDQLDLKALLELEDGPTPIERFYDSWQLISFIRLRAMGLISYDPRLTLGTVVEATPPAFAVLRKLKERADAAEAMRAMRHFGDGRVPCECCNADGFHRYPDGAVSDSAPCSWCRGLGRVVP